MYKSLLTLEPRREPSRTMLMATPFIAFALTLLAGVALFLALGTDPIKALMTIFITPLTTLRGLAELTVKSTPLILIATGLAIGFRAGIWNIGAEGQFTIGALAGGSVALWAYPDGSYWLLPLMMLAGALGGIAWAAIPALLRTRFNTSEILTSLLLVYVAILLLGLLVQGPLRDPQSFNFPESRLFQPTALLPGLIKGTRAHIGFLIAIGITAIAHILMTRHMLGFIVRVYGDAPRAAAFAGIPERRVVWLCFAISGGLAGLAGLFEAAGPVGQLVPQLPSGYGFSAIIVAFLGRLQPPGILAAGLLLGLTYIGGETAQITLRLPSATTSVFQGLLLFFLLATDVLVTHRIRFGRRPVEQQVEAV
jgi:general nucleoside transport system permease protein